MLKTDNLLCNSEDAIIIENKVNHKLSNDLIDYWDSVLQKNKQGIILSLKEISENTINSPNFINITHLEFMQCVAKNLSSYFSNANDKYIIFLKDFYNKTYLGLILPIKS